MEELGAWEMDGARPYCSRVAQMAEDRRLQLAEGPEE